MAIEYPFTAWKVQPSGVPTEITITSSCDYPSGFYRTATRSIIPKGLVYPTKGAAIQASIEHLNKADADLGVRADNLAKRRAKLAAYIAKHGEK